jgi:type IV pilus assembly protein PilC
MPQFRYRVRDVRGQSIEEVVQASSAGDLRNRLREQGMYVLNIQEVQASAVGVLNNIDLSAISLALTGISVRDKSIFSRQFSTLVNAGVSLIRSLTVLEDQTKNPKLKKYLGGIRRDVEQGTALADAMKKYPDCFDKLYTAMIQSGEIGGVLDEVLERLSKLLEDQDRLRRQIKSALTYPVVVLLLAVLISGGMIVFVLPVFKGVFKQLGGELPGLTLFLLNLSDALRSVTGWVIMAALIGGSYFGFKQIYSTPGGRLYIDKLTLNVPLFGDLLQKAAVARFCRTFGALTRSGVPILTSMEIVRDTAGNQVIAEAVDKARAVIREGGQIAPTLAKEKVFPSMAVQMMSVGEETGELDSMLAKVADFYEIEVELAVKGLTSLLEPIMITVLGGLVGTILLSMYLPLFTVFDLIQ